MKKHIALVTNAGEHSGVGSRAFHLAHAIGEQDDLQVSLVMLDGKNNGIVQYTSRVVPIEGKHKHLTALPGFLGSKSISWIRLAKHIPVFDLYDISNQTLSFIAKKRHPNIVTVHDIIELTNPQERKARMLNRYFMSGIPSADRIVAVSEYTKRQLLEHFRMDNKNITVIPYGIDAAYHEIPNFRSTIAYRELLQTFKVREGSDGNSPIILVVGSEHPRKNMQTVLATMEQLKKQFPNILLIKVGDAGLLSGRQKTLDFIEKFDLAAHVKLVGNISSERLNELYNLADVLLFPSYLEGFGMPPLEAMAAGCPVICSNAASLPEVVGDGALMHDPDDVQAFADSIVRIVSDPATKQLLVEKGKENAARYSWNKAAQQTLTLYRT